MKKIMLLTVFLVVMVQHCFALDPSFINKFEGTWYDDAGNVFMTISNGHINGAKVVDIGTPIGSNSGGSANVRVIDDKGYRDIYFEWICHTVNPLLQINNSINLHKAKDPRTFESVGGIYLGMPQSEVLKRYGKPDLIDDKDNPSIVRWLYRNDRWIIGFTFGCVSEIAIFANSTRRFDWSGFNCYNSPDEYRKKYNMNYDNISTGEHFSFAKPTSDYRQIGCVVMSMFRT